MIKMSKQGTQMYKTPSMKVVTLYTLCPYMQLAAVSSVIGNEPGGNVPDYEIEIG